MSVSLRQIHDTHWTRHMNAHDTLVWGLLQTVADKDDPINIRPAYQRPSVWTIEQKERFLGHFLKLGRHPAFVIQRGSVGEASEVVDGQQRLLALAAFFRGDVGANVDGQQVRYADLDEVDQRLARQTLVSVIWVNLPWKRRCELYVDLNSAGTPHTEADLEVAHRAAADGPAPDDLPLYLDLGGAR